ncbi:MAG: hypothetical protein HRT52_18020 [Colwellia sp.]|nr:hypothetical protein [Colwellia sp.]
MPADYLQLAKYAAQLDANVIALQEVENREWPSKSIRLIGDCEAPAPIVSAV